MEQSPWQGHGVVTRQGDELVWQPQYELTRLLSPNFRIRLRELRTGSGRLLMPVASWSEFAFAAARGGYAILIAERSASTLRARGMEWACAEWLLTTRLINRRQFRGPQDFKLVSPVFEEFGTRHLLGMASAGAADSLPELFRLGKQEAKRLGEIQPERQRLIQLGLYAAARRTPLQQPRNVSALVRSAVLNLSLAPNDVTNSEIKVISKRYAEVASQAFTPTGFRGWPTGSGGSLISQLSRARKSGEELEPDRVQATLAELGWRGLLRGAQCVEAQMKAVFADLDEPLRRRDLPLHRALYQRQPWLGGLSHPFLFGVRNFAADALWEVSCSPRDPQSIGTLHRMFQLYATLTDDRRAADRATKSSRSRKTKTLLIDQDRD